MCRIRYVQDRQVVTSKHLIRKFWKHRHHKAIETCKETWDQGNALDSLKKKQCPVHRPAIYNLEDEVTVMPCNLALELPYGQPVTYATTALTQTETIICRYAQIEKQLFHF